MKKKKGKEVRLSLFKIIYLSATLFLFFLMGFLYFNKQPSCANSISCVKELSGKYESKEKAAVFMGKNISVPPEILGMQALQDPKMVLGRTSTANKRIYVDLTNQRLYAYEGENLVYNFLISSGKWGRTPTGDFTIWIKLRYTRMSGGDPSLGTYYNLPNVPYVMFYYNDEVAKSRGFSLHGAYWHNNFGHPMSHGCVNLRPEDAGKLYYWTNPQVTGNVNITYPTDEDPGTPITIYGEAPVE